MHVLVCVCAHVCMRTIAFVTRREQHVGEWEVVWHGELSCGSGEVQVEAGLRGSVVQGCGGSGEGSCPDLSTQDSDTNTDIPSILSEGTAWGMRPLTSNQEISSICF